MRFSLIEDKFSINDDDRFCPVCGGCGGCDCFDDDD